MGTGPKALDTYFPGGSIANNIIVGGDRTLYKENNFYPNSIRQIGFVNYQNGDYGLRADSPYINKGVDGGRIGAEIDYRKVGN